MVRFKSPDQNVEWGTIKHNLSIFRLYIQLEIAVDTVTSVM